jgi:hypothetical protein
MSQTNSVNFGCGKEDAEEGLHGKGVRHDDVAWWNVGVYSDDGQTKDGVFDM